MCNSALGPRAYSHIHTDLRIPYSRVSLLPTFMSLEARLQTASTAYQKLQAELSSAVEARQLLDAQLTETGVVKKVRCAPHFTFARA